jgi:cell division septation protein DedD
MLTAQGRSDDALAFLERAIQLNPGEWSFHSALGIAHDQKGEYQLAQAAYSRALSLKPGESAVFNNAALSYLQSGDLDTAEQMARQAEATTTDKARVQQTIALVERLKSTRPNAAPARAYEPPLPTLPPAEQPEPASDVVASVAPPPGPPTVITPEPLFQEPMDYEAPTEFMEGAGEPIITNTPVASSELPPLEEPWMEMVEITPAAPPPPSTLASLQADPTVRMQAVPKDDLAGPVAPREPAAEAPAPQRQASAPPRQLSVGTNARQPAPAPRTSQPAPAPKPAAVHAYFVQAGAFATEDRADRLAASLNSMGARVSPTTVSGKSLYRVRLGPFKDAQQANDALEVAKSMGHTDLKVVAE